MNSRQLFFASALAGGLFLATATAATRVASSDYAAPAPSTVVVPTELPRSYIGAVINLRLTVDAAGQPSNIEILSERDPVLRKRIVEAVSQWRFSPARQNGIAVGATIELPLELQEG